jgi:hypothetical protein
MFAFDRNNVCAAIVLLLVSICAMPHAACAQANEEVVVAFLGHLHCHRVTHLQFRDTTVTWVRQQ